jgi:hypothetical protein
VGYTRPTIRDIAEEVKASLHSGNEAEARRLAFRFVEL